MAIMLNDWAGLAARDPRGQRALLEDVFDADLTDYEILAASYEGYDYEGKAWVLARRISTSELVMVHGSHCSCNGLEGQWEPEPTTLAYLLSDHNPWRNKTPEVRAMLDRLQYQQRFFPRTKRGADLPDLPRPPEFPEITIGSAWPPWRNKTPEVPRGKTLGEVLAEKFAGLNESDDRGAEDAEGPYDHCPGCGSYELCWGVPEDDAPCEVPEHFQDPDPFVWTDGPRKSRPPEASSDPAETRDSR